MRPVSRSVPGPRTWSVVSSSSNFGPFVWLSAEQAFRVRLNHQPKTMNRDLDEERPLVMEEAHPSRYWLSAFYFPQGARTFWCYIN